MKPPSCPTMLNDPQFEGAVFKFPPSAGAMNGQSRAGRRGSNLKLWNPQVYERLSALLAALAKRFNAHPYFEAVGLQETAMGMSEESTTPQQEDAFFDNLLKLHAQLRTSISNYRDDSIHQLSCKETRPAHQPVQDNGYRLGRP